MDLGAQCSISMHLLTVEAIHITLPLIRLRLNQRPLAGIIPDSCGSWFSHGFQSMIKVGLIDAKDTLQEAGVFDPMVGLLQHAEDKGIFLSPRFFYSKSYCCLAFESFDENTHWKDSRLTAHWALYLRLSN